MCCQSRTLHCSHGEQLYRSGRPGLGFGHRGPLGQGAPVDSVPHKPVSLVCRHTAATLHKHLLGLISFLKGVSVSWLKGEKRWRYALKDFHEVGEAFSFHLTAGILELIKQIFH